jgi:hypothetical protein
MLIFLSSSSFSSATPLTPSPPPAPQNFNLFVLKKLIIILGGGDVNDKSIQRQSKSKAKANKKQSKKSQKSHTESEKSPEYATVHLNTSE